MAKTVEIMVSIKPQLDFVIKAMEELRSAAARATDNLDAAITSLKEMNDESGTSDEG